MSQSLRRSVLAYYAFAATQSAAFTVPIFVLFFQSRGLSLVEIGALEALWTAVKVAFEAPTGYLGDRLGRRNALAVGAGLKALGAAAFTLAYTLPAFAAVIALRAVAATFTSGTRSAWLYDTLAAAGESDRFAAVSGRGRAVGVLGGGLGALAGGALYAVDPAYPWLVEGCVVGAGVLALLGMPDPAERRAADDLGVRAALAVTRRALSRRALAGFVALTGLFFGLLNTVELFVQPVATGVAGLAPGHLGVLYFGFTVLSAAAASQTGRIRTAVGVRAWFAAVPVVLGVAFLGVAALPALAVPAFVLGRVARATSGPLAQQYLNDRLASDGRATVLSAVGMVRSLFVAPLNVLGGALGSALALTHALGVLGGVLAAGALGLSAAWLAATAPGSAAAGA